MTNLWVSFSLFFSLFFSLREGFHGPQQTPTFVGAARSIKALNHEVHEGHKGKEKLFLVLFVFFVVPFFSEPFVTPTFEVIPIVAMAW